MIRTFRVAAALVSGTLALPAAAQPADVIHFWTSGGESRAVAVFAHEYETRGGKWIDDPAVGPQAESALAMNRIAGGNPPTAMQWQTGAPTRELAQQGLLANLDWLADADHWKQTLPLLLLQSVTVDGHVYDAPVDIHGANWMFYSTKIFQALNLQPPRSWDEFFAQTPKLQAAGYIPLAFGANAQQESWLFMALLAGIGGRDTYRAVAIDHDAKVAGSTHTEVVFDAMGRLRQYVDAGSPNRKWNDTLALVETNKAALMIVGDWAKGDFAAANLVLDKDYGCELAPGTSDAYIMAIDAFAFPKTGNPEQINAQHKLADLMMDPAVQTEFTRYKGSIPSRLDADIAGLDHCARQGQQVMALGPAHQLPHFYLVFTPDSYGQYTDLLAQYWANPTMSAAEATKRFATIVAAAGR
jgi:glucose/mannose transport system substrate-binding protein